MKNKQLISTIAISFACLGIGFFGGTKYKSTKEPAFVNQFNQRTRDQAGPGGSRMMGGAQTGQPGGGMNRPVAGEITNIDGKTITVKMSDGSSKIILWGSDTSIVKTIETGATDIMVGNKISVFGQTNPDGSITAQNIQLNPLDKVSTPSATPTK